MASAYYEVIDAEELLLVPCKNSTEINCREGAHEARTSKRLSADEAQNEHFPQRDILLAKRKATPPPFQALLQIQLCEVWGGVSYYEVIDATELLLVPCKIQQNHSVV